MDAASGLYVGVDVGTGSARAGVFDARGALVGAAAREIRVWRPQRDFVEQSSEGIWRAVGEAVRGALAAAGARADLVRGVGFDATCSLVALDLDGGPVTVSPSGEDERNVVVWMDHRAVEQAERINALGHEVLRYVGGTISPEMETPKLLWLRENLPETWRRAARFLDLPDFLVYRATGQDVRSLCSTTCKWTYVAGRGGWDTGYFESVGLGDLAGEGWRRIGTRVRPMGEPVGDGMTPQAATDLGLAPGTAVGVSIIDAHAGGIGMIGATVEGLPTLADDPERRVALIGGTSSCHMAVSREAIHVPGVWGPYESAMIPGLWLTEGGQSATGALIDHVVLSHARGADLAARADREGRTVYDLLNERLDALAAVDEHAASPAALTREIHVQPDFHGNRSPRADPTLRGMITGLTLGHDEDDLALLYLATVQAVAHGTRHVLDALDDAGYRIDTVFVCGGGAKNPVFLREHADVTGRRLVLPAEPEAVLLGSAILGAAASGDRPSLPAAMEAMTRSGAIIEPAGGETAAYHARKHAVFHRMHADQLAYRTLMAKEGGEAL